MFVLMQVTAAGKVPDTKLLAEGDTWLDDVPIVRANLLKACASEHQIELREAENESPRSYQ
jgi:hypothetical protein